MCLWTMLWENQKFESHHQLDYILAFLVGLNESFLQVKSQILLIDPLPLINKVFSVIVQEEKQRQIGPQSAHSHDRVAFAVEGEPNKLNPATTKGDHNIFSRNKPRFNPKNYQKERFLCPVCNIHGHTTETCYKIHDYPPGFNPKPRLQSQNQSAPINQVSNQSHSSENHNEANTAVDNNNGNFFPSVDKNQYYQQWKFLSKFGQQTIQSADE